MRISDWSSDVCSSDLFRRQRQDACRVDDLDGTDDHDRCAVRGKGHLDEGEFVSHRVVLGSATEGTSSIRFVDHCSGGVNPAGASAPPANRNFSIRSEEHTSELQSLMRISYAVFCLKKKKQTT